MESLERQAWLFTQGEQSVRVMRNVEQRVVTVSGPGPVTHSHAFNDIAALDEFLGWYLSHLEYTGWALHATVDRRQQREGVPPHGDRRRKS